jgi:uncharacterized repeat protein (TIGR01451 family)
MLSDQLPELAGTWFLGDDGLGGVGDDWTCTNNNGSHAFQGAASHFRLASEYTGNVEIQIPIAQYPDGYVEGWKIVDVNANGLNDTGDYPYPGGWGISGTAILPIGGTNITFPLADLVTDGNGYYQYGGLIIGWYEVCEDDTPDDDPLNTNWYHTGTIVDGVESIGSQTCSGLIELETNLGEVHNASFLNALGWPELDIDKYCSGKVLVGGDINFTVVLTNTGTKDAEDVEVTDYLPAGVTYVGGATATSGDLDDTSTPGEIVWNGTILKDGGTVNITIPVVASTTGEQLNNATYTQYPGDAVMLYTSAVCSTPVYDPSIDLTKVANVTKILSGDAVMFTYNVTNTGDLPLTVDLEGDQHW